MALIMSVIKRLEHEKRLLIRLSFTISSDEVHKKTVYIFTMLYTFGICFRTKIKVRLIKLLITTK